MIQWVSAIQKQHFSNHTDGSFIFLSDVMSEWLEAEFEAEVELHVCHETSLHFYFLKLCVKFWGQSHYEDAKLLAS